MIRFSPINELSARPGLGWMRALCMATVAAAALYAGAIRAEPIGPICGSCDGGVYTLSYDGNALPDFDALHETFRITFDVDTMSYTGGGSFLDNVAIKVANSLFDVVLVDAPGALSDWTDPGVDLSSGINAGGCSGSGAGFFCIDGLANGGKGVALSTGPLFSFVFDVSVENGILFTGTGEASVKARYVDDDGDKAGSLLSEPITLQRVPEPSALWLIGLGLVAIGVTTPIGYRKPSSHQRT